jgi:acetyl-CoA synthetase
VSRTDNTAVLQRARDLLLATRTDWPQACDTFVWPQLTGQFCWATDWFDAVGRGNPALALWIVEQDGTDQRLSYDDLVRRSDQVATWLAEQGVGRGDRVVLMLGNQVELWESVLAVMKLGAVVLPTTTALGPVDLADRVARGQVGHVIANEADTGKFAQLEGLGRYCVDGAPAGWLDYRAARSIDPRTFEAVTEPGDPLLLYFTSGTTSRPKLVEHTQVSYPVGHLSTMYWIGLQPGDLHLNVSSPGWAKHAWSCLFAPFLAEAAVFVYNYTRFDAGALLEQVHRCEVTTLCAPPTVWRMLVQADLSAGPGALREVVAAGEPLNPEVITQVQRRWGRTVRDGFGQTETTAQVGNPPGQPLKPGSMGRPLPGIPVALVDPLTGAPADEGELCLDLAGSPLALMTGYLGDPERAAEAMAGGYYHTGDVAQRDPEGYLTYVGRTDDVFKSSDYKVSPFELESVLIEHPAVVEAAVVPAPDALRMTVPKAYVTLAAGWAADRATALALLEHTRAHLPPFLRVRRLEFVDELPKTISGKIRRVELRQAEQDASHGTQWRDEDFPELRSAR